MPVEPQTHPKIRNRFQEMRMKRFGWLAVGLLVWTSRPACAQDRLTWRPREVATGTWKDVVGMQRLFPEGDSRDDMIYVPRQCTETAVERKRCPLLVYIPAYGDWELATQYIIPVADKYGMILANLGPKSNLDAMLKQALQTLPIDPDKIAVMGVCGTGGSALGLGGRNSGVFSRIIALSGGLNAELVNPFISTLDPPNRTTEYLVAYGLPETADYFWGVQELRRLGHHVTHAIGFLTHGSQVEMYDYFGRWLQESWESSDTARPAPQVVANPLPLLTSDMLAKMTDFWTRFVQLPETIQTTARQAHLREVVVPVGREQLVLPMTDMAALAAQYPSVAADLKAVGLTAQQHEAYRVALASARATASLAGYRTLVPKWVVTKNLAFIDSNSVVAKNVVFAQAHQDELAKLEQAETEEGLNMWTMP